LPSPHPSARAWQQRAWHDCCVDAAGSQSLREPSSFFDAMHKHLASRHSRPQVSLSAARSLRRAPARALRHHAARTSALSRRAPANAYGVHGEEAGGTLRTWLSAVFSMLRSRTRARRLLLRGLLRHTKARRAAQASAQRAAAAANRRPRRLSASAGWFAFAAR
jgi:hypothetical protein